MLRAVHRDRFLEYIKMRRVQAMKPHHEEARKEWCQHKIDSDENFRRWVFTDEKKFNLDAPDGWAYYWHDTRMPELTKSKRQRDGGHVMV